MLSPLRPPVPPKPSKSKEASLGQTLLVPIEVPCCSLRDENQSFETDDEPGGDNLALEPPSSISEESFHLSQHTSNPASGDGNPSQKSVLEEVEEADSNKSLILSSAPSPNSTGEAINQEHLITAASVPSNSNDTNAAATITTTKDPIRDSHCPFYKLHHKTSSEFLSCPEILKNDKSILFGIDDFSSKVEQKIGFIVENLKDCAGIWPIMFLEKLNKIIVRCELPRVQSYFHENSGILSKLLQSFAQEKRCSMVFRYWCTFYNLLARRVVCFSTLASTELLPQLQRDFILASNESCRCSPDGVVSMKESCSQHSDDQHPIIEFELQLQILAILMIPLITSRAEDKSIKALYASVDTPDPKTFLTAFISGMTVVSKAENSTVIFSDTTKETQPNENTNNILLKDANEKRYVSAPRKLQKETLVHLLIVYNLEFEEAEFNPIVELLTTEDLHRQFIINNIIGNLHKEHKLLEEGCYSGTASLYPPVGVIGKQATGIRGPLQLIISILKENDTLLGLNDVLYLFNVSVEVQTVLSQEKVQSELDEKTRVQIINECVKMDALLETRLRSLELNSRSASSSSLFLREGGGLKGKSSITDRSISTSSISHDSDAFSSTVSLPKAFGDVWKNCFGCSKSKKKMQTTVSPANLEDIDESVGLPDE